MTNASLLFENAWNVEAEGIDLSKARVGGRATKANPGKEDVSFWKETGPKWVQGYIEWRAANPDWKIWVAPDGNPAIELGLFPEIAGVPVKMVIDRIFEVNGELVIADLKTSKSVPVSPLQLSFYRLGIKKQFGIDIKWGTYWMARQFGISPMIDLNKYTDDMLEYLVENFDKARKSGIFLPNTSTCQYMCGLTEYCQFSTKEVTNG